MKYIIIILLMVIGHKWDTFHVSDCNWLVHSQAKFSGVFSPVHIYFCKTYNRYQYGQRSLILLCVVIIINIITIIIITRSD